MHGSMGVVTATRTTPAARKPQGSTQDRTSQDLVRQIPHAYQGTDAVSEMCKDPQVKTPRPPQHPDYTYPERPDRTPVLTPRPPMAGRLLTDTPALRCARAFGHLSGQVQSSRRQA